MSKRIVEKVINSRVGSGSVDDQKVIMAIFSLLIVDAVRPHS